MKYAALVLNILAVVVLGWALSGVVDLTRSKTKTVRPTEIPEMRPVAESALAAQQETVAALAKIAGAGDARAQKDSPEIPHLVDLPPAGSSGSAGPQLPQRRLSLLAEISNDRVAVIDGKIVRKGQRLPHGGRVLSIKQAGVSLRETHGGQKLKFDLSRLRVGTLRSEPPPDTDVTHFSKEGK